jgi:drug/metabolite transporter (DMT)-like permease
VPPATGPHDYRRGVSRGNAALLVVLSAIWGSSFLFIKLGVDELEPTVVALGRLFVGAAILVPIAASRGGLGLLRPHFRTVATLGLLNNALPFWLFGFAETRISSGLAGVIQAAAPIFTVLLAIRLDPTQRATGTRLAGIGVGFVGVALLVGAQTGGQIVGALAVLAASLCYAASALIAGKRAGPIPPLHLAAGQLACGLVLMAPFGLLQLPDEAPPAKAVLAIVALGALGSAVAYVLYFALIARAGASRAILVTYLVPAFALVYGAVFLDEAVTASALAGLVLILAGTTLATGVARLRRPRVAAEEGA